MPKTIFSLLLIVCILYCTTSPKGEINGEEFPEELVRFVPYSKNPAFAGTSSATWDNQIRERGFILQEDSFYFMWYTGYTNIDSVKYLGYATSPDGFTWTRYPGNPIYNSNWVEDMSVSKDNGTYYMFAEGKGDTAHWLTSTDRIHWKEQGDLDIRLTNGNPISKGPYGTPTIFRENNKWYLFYERDDLGIWLATSSDCKKWINVQDEPVLNRGPEAYDQFAVAMNQVFKYKGLYYGYYHASAFKDWHEWSTNVAVSADLINWKKYAKNPIVGNNRSSGIMVNDGKRCRLYTMHPEVNVYLPVTDSLP